MSRVGYYQQIFKEQSNQTGLEEQSWIEMSYVELLSRNYVCQKRI